MAENTDIDWALGSLKERLEGYRLYKAYYDGHHRLDFIPSDYRPQFARLLANLSMNLCPAIIDALKDRLQLTGFTPDSEAQALDDAINEVWRRNLMDQRQAEVTLEALKCGDSYVIVWPNPRDEITIYPQEADLMTVEYDEEEPGLIVKAAKIFETREEKLKVILYYDDRVERYISMGKARPDMRARDFEPFVKEGEYDNVIGHSYGRVPVFHFGNNAPLGKFGKSELSEVIPLQDALNKTYRDTIVTGDMHSLPQRWITGVELPIDERTRQAINPFISGDLWTTASENAKFGQLGAAELTPFVAVKESFIKDVCLVTGTPPSHFYLGGDPPSGESLKVLESRLTKRAHNRCITFGNVWEEVFKFCLQLSGLQSELDAVWARTETRSEVDDIDNAIKKIESLNFSDRQVKRELGYTEEEIDRMREEMATEDVIPLTEQ